MSISAAISATFKVSIFYEYTVRGRARNVFDPSDPTPKFSGFYFVAYFGLAFVSHSTLILS